MSKKRCVQCHCAFIPLRNPDQRFCNKRPCQNARKRQWRKQKRSKDPDYRENQRRAQKKSSYYWNNYRQTHPEYTQRNRNKQKIRDMRRARSELARKSHLAKSDALMANNLIKSGTYRLIPTYPNLAKSDALTVNISLIT